VYERDLLDEDSSEIIGVMAILHQLLLLSMALVHLVAMVVMLMVV
jgi:hypothetical protein